MLELGEHADPAAAAATVLAIDTRLAAGHWERAETRDVQKTYNLRTLRRADASSARRSTGTPTSATSAAPRRPSRRCASGSRRTSRTSSTVLDETPIEDWKTWMLSRVLRSAAPYLTDDFVETNFDFYGRTLSGTPELRARWKRGVGFVEGADRRGGRRGVRRPALPAASARS